jgi:hypothetical protein
MGVPARIFLFVKKLLVEIKNILRMIIYFSVIVMIVIVMMRVNLRKMNLRMMIVIVMIVTVMMRVNLIKMNLRMMNDLISLIQIFMVMRETLRIILVLNLSMTIGAKRPLLEEISKLEQINKKIEQAEKLDERLPDNHKDSNSHLNDLKEEFP